MNEIELYTGELALELVPVFSGSEAQSAKWFIRELEEALDLSNITIGKYKKYYFKEKLEGLPLQWYENVRDDNDYQSMTWDLLKKKFLKEFDTKELILKDTNRLLMNCCQNEGENVRSYYIRITKLFNEFKQISGKSLNEEDEVEYFINGLLPICKLQLNNCYQNVDGSYFNILLKEVLETTLMLERNGIVYEEEMKQLSSDVDQMRRNVENNNKHIRFKKKIEKEDLENINANEVEQVVFNDQSIMIANAVRDLGEMNYLREKNDFLHNDRWNSQSTSNLIGADGFNKTCNNKSGDFNNYVESYSNSDSGLNSEERTNENELQGCSYKRTDKDTIDSQIVRNELIVIRDEETEKKLDRNDNLQKEVDVISSESCNNTRLSINSVNSKSTVRQGEEVELGEDTGKEEGIYNIKCESEKEINESDVNYKSTEQYNLFSIGSVEKDRKNNFKLTGFKVKANGYYNYWDERKEVDALEKIEEEKNMSVMRKEPKPPWKITMLTEQEGKVEAFSNYL